AAGQVTGLSCARSAPRGAGGLLLPPHDELRAPVQAARLFARVVVLGPLFTVAHGAEPVRGHAARRQVVADGGAAALAEAEVVLGGADAAGVAFDLEPQRRVVPHRADRLVEDAHRFGPQRVAV